MSNKSKYKSDLMRAVEIVKFGGPENLKITKRPIPEIEKNEVLIKVQFSGVNRPDILQREGNYPVPKSASDIPGLEVSGINSKLEKKYVLFAMVEVLLNM